MSEKIVWSECTCPHLLKKVQAVLINTPCYHFQSEKATKIDDFIYNYFMT